MNGNAWNCVLVSVDSGTFWHSYYLYLDFVQMYLGRPVPVWVFHLCLFNKRACGDEWNVLLHMLTRDYSYIYMYSLQHAVYV